MSQQSLNVSLFYALFHEMGSKTVTETMGSDPAAETGISNRPTHDLLQGADSKVPAGKFIGKEDASWSAFREPVFCKQSKVSF